METRGSIEKALPCLLLSLVFILLPALSLVAQSPDFTQLKARAEKLFTEGSYKQAWEEYSKAGKLSLSADQKRWVEFRLADSSWRAESAGGNSDYQVYDKIEKELLALAGPEVPSGRKDLLWEQIQESLGDLKAAPPLGSGIGYDSVRYYAQALDFWAGSQDIEVARENYFRILWKLQQHGNNYLGYSLQRYDQITPETLNSLLPLARTDSERARVHLLIALDLQRRSPCPQHERINEEYESSLLAGRASEWYDEALYAYAQWLSASGHKVIDEKGACREEPDHARALAIYERIMTEYQKGETPYYEMAKARIEEISRVSLVLTVSNVFLPGSEIRYSLSWHNLESIELTLYRGDMAQLLTLVGSNYSANYPSMPSLSGLERVRSWTKDTGDRGRHLEGRENPRLEFDVPAGAYILEARGGNLACRELLLVTDATLVLRNSSKRGAVYFCNATDGAPIAGATVQVWLGGSGWGKGGWQETLQTDADGIARFDLPALLSSSYPLTAAAKLADRQAFARCYQVSPEQGRGRWVLYACTDRPAYRPGESVRWKVTGRRWTSTGYETPDGEELEYEIHDPKNARIKTGSLTLNSFGSAWDTLDLAQDFPLGSYKVSFLNPKTHEWLGESQFFRLEEYKLPEFKVAVETGEQGKKKTYRPGDKVAVTIRSQYYSGGPVASASVDVAVYQRSFSHTMPSTKEFPWLYEEPRKQDYGSYRGQVVQRATLHSGPDGTVIYDFDTSSTYGQDAEYEIVAKVTDSSRREVEGSGSVRVSFKPYYVDLNSKVVVAPPLEPVTIDVRALDANDQPVVATGTILVTMDKWKEIWLDPCGREVTGKDLEGLRQKGMEFPPDQGTPCVKPWQKKFAGFTSENVRQLPVKTWTQRPGHRLLYTCTRGLLHLSLEKRGGERATSRGPDRGLGGRWGHARHSARSWSSPDCAWQRTLRSGRDRESLACPAGGRPLCDLLP